MDTGLRWPHYVLLGLLVLLVILAIANRSKMRAFWESTKKFLREVKIEMQKVTWPTRNDIYASTFVVMVCVIVLTIIISIWDQVLSMLVRVLLTGKGA